MTARTNKRKIGQATFKPGYEVMNLKTHNSHGIFESLIEAKGCVLYDNLQSWQIWLNSSVLIAEKDLS